jgi:branched-chain amino acid transport system ATP-binding protein
MLELEGVRSGYGAVDVLFDVSLRVGAGEVVALLGANGAGKSTVLRTVSGLLRPRTGQIRFLGERIDGLPPPAVVARGVAHVPEGREVFAELTIAENLRMGAYRRTDRGVASDLHQVLEWFPVLRERYRQPAGQLSGGEQQMLAIARALMARPKLLLLDEPSLGLAPKVVQQILDIVRRLQATGVTILLAEQNAYLALRLASRAYVLRGGRVALEGPVEELRGTPEVERLYLGS